MRTSKAHSQNKRSLIRLTHGVIVKAPGLLPMLYTVRELACDLDIPERTLRDWLKVGAPHQKDHRNHTWINGNDFAHWVRSQQKTKKPTLPSNRAYCFRCKTVVILNNPEQHHIRGKLIHIVGQCETCGCTINRGGRLGKTG